MRTCITALAKALAQCLVLSGKALVCSSLRSLIFPEIKAAKGEIAITSCIMTSWAIGPNFTFGLVSDRLHRLLAAAFQSTKKCRPSRVRLVSTDDPSNSKTLPGYPVAPALCFSSSSFFVKGVCGCPILFASRLGKKALFLFLSLQGGWKWKKEEEKLCHCKKIHSCT